MDVNHMPLMLYISLSCPLLHRRLVLSVRADDFTDLDVVRKENGGTLTLISTAVDRENLTNYLPVLQRKFTSILLKLD